MIRIDPPNKPFIVMQLPHGMSFQVRPSACSAIVGIDGEPLETDKLRLIVAQLASQFIDTVPAGGWRN